MKNGEIKFGGLKDPEGVSFSLLNNMIKKLKTGILIRLNFYESDLT